MFTSAESSSLWAASPYEIARSLDHSALSSILGTSSPIPSSRYVLALFLYQINHNQYVNKSLLFRVQKIMQIRNDIYEVARFFS